ncbi:MAG: 1-deoxy-D-xylulose-5-phosphate synthase [Candidatus Omnitrophica bacterium]|nr:1-deoxy-D-xylulose-5-phosphate synthase [Candidatus Omnitrophota bacterium]
MFLENIQDPEDLKKLSLPNLVILCQEIRRRIIEVVSITGGHLASSLGAVELIVALHYCLDLPYDKIIFDVGHQAYAHKLLTARNKDFSTLRQYGGISGFPSKEESIYDVFTTGHSSVAVSLALGLVCARDLLKETKPFKVVAVIGDGSLSGGVCFEGLNNAGHLKKDLLVILNTNELSISPNVGALSTYINKFISLPIYNRFRQSLEQFIRSRIPKGSRLLKLVDKFEEALKGLFIPGIFFEELGFRYFGPIDGHNLEIIIPTLKNIFNLSGPRILHVVTKKGKGYLPAEEDPVRFHSALPFEIETGKPKITDNIPTYTEIFSKKLIALAKENSKIVAITAAMPAGTGLDRFRDNFPERFFDVGIAEQHAVSFAAGLACGGLKPIVAIYSTFLQRAYDQIIEDICLQNLGVVLVIDRAGIVGEDGPTHQGIFDIAYLKNLPHLVFMAPKDAKELEMMLEFAVNLNKPAAIRYPKSKIPNSPFQIPEKIELGKAEVLKEGEDFVIIALGSMVIAGLEAVELLEKEGFKGMLLNARFISPLDTHLFKDLSRSIKYIFTIEEGIIEGGFGSSVMEVLDRPVIRMGLSSEFVPSGKREILLDKYGLTKEKISQRIKEVIKNNG